MQINKAVASDNKSRPAATAIELARGLGDKFRQELAEMVTELDREGLSPPRFHAFTQDLRRLVSALGAEAVTQTLEMLDVAQPSVEVDGRRLRYRGPAIREWLTVFGKVEVARRIYRGDGPGAGKHIPIDDACGMSGRFMTPDVEEMSAMALAMLTQGEAELIVGKLLPRGPSATAIRNAVGKLASELESRNQAIEDAIDKDAPLSTEGDILVASWDGVMVPMRAAAKGEAIWKEAGVAAVSIYGPGKDGPDRLDTRYLARMPEPRMDTLVDQVVAEVVRARKRHDYRVTVVLCDGDRTIWRQVEARPELEGATLILDFFHASENLMKAAKAIFGDTDCARRWHEKLRFKLKTSWGGVECAIRSMRRYRSRASIDSDRRKIISNVIGYFANNRERMRYAEFLGQGLPIGSGVVESAAKNIVQARLKRSGMRWSMDGGQHVLDLRAHLKSGRWDVMWGTLKAAA